MKIVILTLLATLALSVEIESQAMAEVMQPADLRAHLQGFTGTYDCSGTFTLFRIRSFETDMNRRTPVGFVLLDKRDFTRVASLGVIHYAERI